MRRRLLAVSTISAMLALHLGVVCLAVARTHDAMPMDDTRCEAGATAQQKLLCAAPSTLAPPTSHASQPVAAGLEALPTAPPASVASPSPPEAPEPVPLGIHPAFLLHRALLI